jgi:uncharacterized membrane protein YvbJ
MYCSKCGAENAEGNKICSNCGAALTEAASPSITTQTTIVAPKTSGFAVASLVLGIIGIFFGLCSILAIIFGGMALSQISKNPELKGKGQAVAGLVLGIVVVALGIIVTIILIIAGISFWRPL